ncbi:MAG: DegT/DnrJ/EryC1/StrS family aminotransferase [Proteobacteria bacterium]|nr:DegT/DnrJ/EryC1/StrS family aminotransferase [Pseudomonadota bacterium]MBT5190196.1 DegT/DnrJ/EryC1/StrS family aminotransferase [Pseudomonadota bacterium]MBT6933148.1 DegT/DnrJ/EryC1/StrS family aminotransferase [Pseudomonadota bacterium]MBT7966314.1 DegT/DnrJ/EryC1/StrS family aminotransferase [Pseudomonadota bacterium]
MTAAARLGPDTRVVTTDLKRVKWGGLFIDEEAVGSLKVERKVNFVDLVTQQKCIRSSLEENIHRVLHHGSYVMGPEITELEQRLMQMSGAAHCVGVASGTDALLIALMASDVGPGDEVITSPFTFFATAETIALLGAIPIYVDVDPFTFNIDANRIESAITARTKAIMPVGLYGQCAEMDEINALATKHSLIVIEDAAQSFGATYKKRQSCALSHLACTSFFPAKPLGAYGDAGACFAQDEDLAKKIRQIRDHGQDSRYHHIRLGINGRLDTIQAAVLLAKLDIFESEVVSRQRAAARYETLLADKAQQGLLALPVVLSHNTSTWAQYTVRVKNRSLVQQSMTEAGIPTAVHYPTSLYRQPALKQSTIECEQSDRAANEVLSLPMHPYLTDEIQKQIAKCLSEAIDASGASPSFSNKENSVV